jgi:hypothetical protein
LNNTPTALVADGAAGITGKIRSSSRPHVTTGCRATFSARVATLADERNGEIKTEKTFRDASEQFLREYHIITQGHRNKEYISHFSEVAGRTVQDDPR